VTSPAAGTELRDRALAEFGTVDVLVNDAGQGLHLPLAEVDSDHFRAVWELNVLAPLALMQAGLPAMPPQGEAGSIVNVSSGTSLRAISGLRAYGATKAALNMLALVARLEFGPLGVAGSVVYPGVTATEFHRSLRAGRPAPGAAGMALAPPELVAEGILGAVRSGEAEIRVAQTRVVATAGQLLRGATGRTHGRSAPSARGAAPVGVFLPTIVWLATAEPLGRAPTDSASVPDQAAALELAQRSAEEMFRADLATGDLGTVVEEVGPGRRWTSASIVPATTQR
jgi:NAD(P)-dependent dehydrogenase (short-subunit alcohol dehydrogenase family)